MESTTHRKPYQKPVHATWWMTRKKYILYMLRELTAVVNLWCVAELIVIVLGAYLLDEPQSWLASFIQHPVVIVLNCLALVATCYHIYTWYKIFPEGIRIFTSRDPANTNLVPAPFLIAALYFVTLVASVLIICALTFA